MSWNILEISTNVGIAYFVSWTFFFLTLPLFITVFGKVKGSAINYGISWLVMLGVAWLIEKYDLINKIKTFYI